MIALCSCDDLGAYTDTTEYYNAFGDIVMIDGASGDTDEYSVETYFYNEESRENFLKGEDGAYNGVPHGEYVYVAIPFESTIDMDTVALYVQAQSDVTVYINVFVTDAIPTNWVALGDLLGSEETDEDSETDGGDGTENEEPEYDDPDPDSRIGEIAVYLKKGEWGSFLLDDFRVNGTQQQSIEIKDGQYILLQIRNNSGVRVLDEEKQVYVDPQTGLELPTAEITMTNLLIRALDVKAGNEAQGGE